MGGFIRFDKITAIIGLRQAIENELLAARQVLEKSVKELNEAQDRLMKFRFHNKPVSPFVSRVSPELLKVIETTERISRLEALLEKTGFIPGNDNTPLRAPVSP